MAIEAARGVCMASLAPLEWGLRRGAERPAEPPCFVVGPPRSGTTLLFELLIRRYRFAYISNLAHRLYRTPVAASRLFRGVIGSWRGSFESDYGHVDGWGAPNEGGWVWGRWMPESTHLDAARADALAVSEIRSTVAGIAAALDAPFLSKNVMHSAHMQLLDRVFPGCVFIEIRRDPVANVRSILRAREAGAGPTVAARDWFSLKPLGWEAFRDADPVEQAAAQVFLTRRMIEGESERLGAARLVRTDYETLTADPGRELARIHGLLADQGIRAEDREEIRPEFRNRNPGNDDSELRDRVERVRCGLASGAPGQEDHDGGSLACD